MYPEFEPFNTTYKINHPRPTDTTFDTYVAFILPHISNIAEASASNPFAMHIPNKAKTPAASYCRARIVNLASPVVFGGVNDDDLSLEPQTALPAYVACRVPAVALRSAR